MKKTLKKITIQEVTKIFSDFSNYPTLFDTLAFKKKKVPVSFLIPGKIEESEKQAFIEGNDFSTKFLIQYSGDNFLFNELIEDDFYVLSATYSFFNVKIVESFEAYSFSRSLLCEKENPFLPALILSYINDDEYWFLVR